MFFAVRFTLSWCSPPVRNATNLQTFCFKDHHYESFFLSKDSLSCATHTLDLCILFKFIFLYLRVHSAPFLRISQVLLAQIFSYVYYHAEYFSCPRWCRWSAKAGNLILIFNFSSQSPHLNAWPSGQRIGLAIRRSRVRVPLWPLAGFVLGRPEFKFSAMIVNSQLVAFCQLGFLILLCCIWIICF